jgi:hypothetical protein
MIVLIYMHVPDNRGIPDNGYVSLPRYIITVNVRIRDIPSRHKYPVRGRDTNGNIDINPGRHGSPSIVIRRISPDYPGWSPLYVGNPNPAVVTVK